MEDSPISPERGQGTGEDLARRTARLSDAKRALLKERLRGRLPSSSMAAAIPRRPQGEPPPLSFAQERLWFLDQLVPCNTSFNIPSVLRLDGRLDVRALRSALTEIVRRHEVLRTTFTAVGAQAVQVIADAFPVELPLTDLRHLPVERRDAEVLRRCREEAALPFDLARGPLFRANLLQLGNESHILLFTLHHIVADEWSVAILVRELTALYTANTGVPAPPLPELPIQYADYAVWQRQWLRGEVEAEQLAYWRQYLEGAPPLLELPLDRARPAVQTFRGASQSFTLPRDLTDALGALSRQADATLFMTLLAAFNVLLFRYTRQEQIVVSTGAANRNRRETEPLIGCLINVLLLRNDLSGDPTFRELLGRVRKTALGAFAHQDLPFEKLVLELQPERDMSYHPFSQVMFVLLNAPTEPLALPGLRLTPMPLETETTQYDLLLHMWMDGDGLGGRLRYATDLFDHTTIARLLAHFWNLLNGISADPDRRLSALPLLSDVERRQQVVEWNDTSTSFPEDVCLHELFVQQARKQPDACAVICGDAALTYDEVHRRSNQLANHLRSLGVRPGTAVGICMERSAETVVALMAILKAGGTYTPLDPTYPRERLAFMLDDARVPVLLTQDKLRDALPSHAAQTVVIDAEWADIARASDRDPASGVTADELCYIIYTSGSTGRPKGVMLDHRGRVNNFLDFNRRFGVGPRDRLLAVSSLSFDMFAYDVFGTLAAGAAIVLPEAPLERDPEHWAELMVRHRVSIWHSVPALLEQLVDYVAGQPDLWPRHLRLVLLGGDWIPVALPDRLQAICNGVQVISLGGATEASMDSIIYPIQAVDPAWSSIPYGRPMANQLAYVLDADSQLLPVGVPGELHLGGAGIAWGYLERPDLTAEKFVPDPFSPRPGARLYRTGDLARHRAGGIIDLLGRMDHQVKIRGLRIELGEIAARLKQHPHVEECIVVVTDVAAGDRRLFAYVVGRGQTAPTSDELRAFARETLPEYMVPSAFVRLQTLPLTPNGKVDRKALPLPDTHETRVRDFVAATTPIEEVLAGIWGSVLQRKPIGMHDDFFELGGHSLLATQVISRVREIFHIDMPLRTLFQAPTVGDLAEAIEMAGQAAGRDLQSVAEIFLRVVRLSDDEARALLGELSGQRADPVDEP